MNRRNLICALPAAVAAALPVFRQRSRAILSVEEARVHAGLEADVASMVEALESDEIVGPYSMIIDEDDWHDFDQDLQRQAAQALAEETDRMLLEEGAGGIPAGVLEISKDLTVEEVGELQRQVDEYGRGLRRFIVTRGVGFHHE